MSDDIRIVSEAGKAATRWEVHKQSASMRWEAPADRTVATYVSSRTKRCPRKKDFETTFPPSPLSLVGAHAPSRDKISRIFQF
eukprot:6207174-Pleurochrysis_carterae.AAC.1